MRMALCGSREQATRLADKTLGIAERLGHLGAAFMVLIDRIRKAAMLGDLPQRGGAWPADRGHRRARRPAVALRRPRLPRAWPPTGEAMRNAPRPSCETPSSWSRRAHSPGKAPRCWRGTSPTTGALDEVMELFESARSKLPSLDRVNGLGSWSCLLNFVEAFYLCGLYEEAAALTPLVERVLELRQEMAHLGWPAAGDLAPVSSPRRLVGGMKPNATSASLARSPSRCRNRLELADLGPPAGPDAARPRRNRRPRARRRDAPRGFVRLPHVWHACLRR